MRHFFKFFRGLTLVPQGVTIVSAAFLPIFAIVSMFPAVPSIIEHFGANPNARWMVPMMVSAPGLTIAIFAPFAGYAADRFGRRKLLIWSTFLYGMFGTAPVLLDNISLIFASRLLLGVAEAGILTLVNTLIGDYWDDRGRRDWLFLQGVVGPFVASGVILAAGPATAIRWNGVFLIYLVAFPVFLAMVTFLFEPKKDGATVADFARAPAAGTPFPFASIALIGATTLFTSMLYYVFIINGGLAFKEVGIVSPARLSEITAIPSLFVIVGACIFRLLGGKPNEIQIATFLLLIGGGLAIIGLAPDYRWMIGGLAIQQTGAGMTVGTLIAWAQTRLPFENRGRGMGVWSSSFFLGQFISPWFVHALERVAGTMQGAFLAAGLVGIAGSAVAILCLIKTRHPSVKLHAAPQ